MVMKNQRRTRVALRSFVAIGLLAAAAIGIQHSAIAQTTKAQTVEANKKLAAAFFRKDATPAERVALLHPDYVQHNPLFQRFNDINNMHGRDAVEAFVKARAAAGAPPPTPPNPGNDPTYLIMADGDLVTVLHKQMLPDPQNAGKFYESFTFDTWRVKDGKLYEHWDGATIPDKVPEFLGKPQSK
jgi:predicted SnoaL-like aldol condensation-catalyzing enzyme